MLTATMKSDEVYNEFDALADIAKSCDLLPDTATGSAIIPFGSKRESVEHFCTLALMQGFHVTVDDFEAVYGLV